MREATTKLILHDQRGDTITHRYSVQTEEGGVLFLFDPVGITAREVMDRFCRQSNYYWELRHPDSCACSTCFNKAVRAAEKFQAPDTGHTEGQSKDTASEPGSAAAPRTLDPGRAPDPFVDAAERAALGLNPV